MTCFMSCSPTLVCGEWTLRTPLANIGQAASNIDTATAPDGSQWIIYTRANRLGGAGNEYREVMAMRQTNSGATTSYSLGVVSVVGAPLSAHRLRVASGGGSTWAVWRKDAGFPELQIRRLYPPHVAGTATTIPLVGIPSEAFDLAVGDDGQPRLALIDQNRSFYVLMRRQEDGQWRTKDIFPNTPTWGCVDVGIALAGPKIHLFQCTYSVEVPDPEGNPGGNAFSYLSHREAVEPADWGNLVFSDPVEIDDGVVSAGGEGFKIQAREPRAAVTAGGSVAVIYQNEVFVRASVAIRPAMGSWSVFALPVVEGTTPSGPGHDVATVDNVFHFVWQSNNPNTLNYATMESGFFNASRLNGLAGSPAISITLKDGPRLAGFSNSSQIQAAILKDATDDDGDGFTVLEELAYDLDNPVQRPPAIGVREYGGVRYWDFTYYRRAGGTASANPYSAGGFSYLVQSSTDLTNWNTLGIQYVPGFNGGAGTAARYRANLPYGEESQRYFRVKTRRLGLR